MHPQANKPDKAGKQAKGQDTSVLALKRRIEHAQRLVRKHVKPGVSLVDELIAERLQAAKIHVR